MVLAARGDKNAANGPLSLLCSSYWYPLYAFVRRQGVPANDAQDLTQEFFARLLSGAWLQGVDPARGRFRSWLIVCMKHFLSNEWDKARAQKRGGQRPKRPSLPAFLRLETDATALDPILRSGRYAVGGV